MACPDIAWTAAFATVGAVDLVHVDLTAGAQCYSAAMLWLDAAERRRWERLRGAGIRRKFALCRAALRCHLCSRLQCPNDRLAFGARPYGKPFAIVNGEPVPYRFNVSHSGAHGLVGFSPDTALGVDVEERSPHLHFDAIGARVFGPGERTALASARGRDKMLLFYRLWTLKEALIKAEGAGFLHDPSGFEVPPAVLGGAHSGTLWLSYRSSAVWRVQDVGEARFAAAVAYEV